MSIENIRTLLSGFGGSIGLPGLVPDDDGYAALSFDDLPVHLQFDAEADELVETDPTQAERFFGNRLVQGLGAFLGAHHAQAAGRPYLRTGMAGAAWQPHGGSDPDRGRVVAPPPTRTSGG